MVNSDLIIINNLKEMVNKPILKENGIYFYSGNKPYFVQILKNSPYRKEFLKLKNIISYKNDIVRNKNLYNKIIKSGFKVLCGASAYKFEGYKLRLYFLKENEYISEVFQFWTHKAFNEFCALLKNIKTYNTEELKNILNSYKEIGLFKINEVLNYDIS